jgi:hypothetical protein
MSEKYTKKWVHDHLTLTHHFINQDDVRQIMRETKLGREVIEEHAREFVRENHFNPDGTLRNGDTVKALTIGSY